MAIAVSGTHIVGSFKGLNGSTSKLQLRNSDTHSEFVGKCRLHRGGHNINYRSIPQFPPRILTQIMAWCGTHVFALRTYVCMQCWICIVLCCPVQCLAMLCCVTLQCADKLCCVALPCVFCYIVFRSQSFPLYCAVLIHELHCVLLLRCVCYMLCLIKLKLQNFHLVS